MKQRGRKSAAELSVVGVSTSITRIPPPKHLSKKASVTWRKVMASKSSEMIDPEAYPILIEYCRTVEQADNIAAQLEKFDPSWLKADGGLKRFNKLLTMQARASATMTSIAVKLRLTPSTRIRADAAARIVGRASGTQKPWDDKTK